MSVDIKYMQRALQLAEGGLGKVSPNPIVGCVIVESGEIIGEGLHEAYGGPHAEVNAINVVKDQERLTKATVYVTLEPCCHHGKTPPCADMLSSFPVKRVVVAAHDPNPKVNGRGIARLREAGIKVETGLLELEAKKQNRRFFKFFEKNRPFITLKWAETLDGFIARKDFSSKWISSTDSRRLVHKWRAQEDAILVGRRTAQFDNPQLNSRDWIGSNPLRIVIDTEKRLPHNLYLLDAKGKTIVYTYLKGSKKGNLEWVQLSQDNFLSELLEDLYQRKVQSLIVEGGSSTINHFINQDLWDEARVFIGNSHFQQGIKAPILKLEPERETKINQDRLLEYSNIQQNGRA